MCQRQSIMSQCKAALRLHPSPLSAPGRGAGCKLGCTADGKQGLHMHMITTSRPLSLAVLQAQTWRSDWHPWYGCRIQGLETKADAAAPGCSALEKQPALAVQMNICSHPRHPGLPCSSPENAWGCCSQCFRQAVPASWQWAAFQGWALHALRPHRHAERPLRQVHRALTVQLPQGEKDPCPGVPRSAP